MVPRIEGVDADKWYCAFLRRMKKKLGEHWLNYLTEEEQKIVLKAHQAATVAWCIRREENRHAATK